MEEENDDFLDDFILSSIPIPSPTKKIIIESSSQEVASQDQAKTNSSIDSNQNNEAGSIKTFTKFVTASKGNSILVNPKQRGNPLLKAINTIWEYEDILPDYIVGATSCVLFLSIKYHNLNPDYIHTRLKQLGKNFELRILLVQVDIKEPHNALKHLTRICLLADLTLMLAWNAEEAGKIIETYKSFENKPPDAIMERAEQEPYQKLATALTNIKPINKTDAMTLLQNYGTLENLINTTEEKLSQCPGLGPRKAKKLYKTLNENFLQ